MIKKLAYDYKFEKLAGYDFRSKVREFLDNGASRFVIKSTLLKQMIEDKERIEFVHKVCHDMNVEFSSVHGLDGKSYQPGRNGIHGYIHGRFPLRNGHALLLQTE